MKQQIQSPELWRSSRPACLHSCLCALTVWCLFTKICSGLRAWGSHDEGAIEDCLPPKNWVLSSRVKAQAEDPPYSPLAPLSPQKSNWAIAWTMSGTLSIFNQPPLHTGEFHEAQPRKERNYFRGHYFLRLGKFQAWGTFIYCPQSRIPEI